MTRAAPSAPHSEIPARDWQGQAITEACCARCAHAALRSHAQHPCAPGHRCVHDAYARRIDRFFRHHPQLAGACLAHPYFEVRAIAARLTDLFGLTTLLNDPDETVRWEVACRATGAALAAMANDSEPEVRGRALARITLGGDERANQRLETDHV